MTTITEAHIAAGAIREDHLSGGKIVDPTRLGPDYGLYRANLGAASRYFTNCCNCGAPRTANECSYCKSVTP